MSVILIKSNFAGHCQATDTICVPVQQMKKVYGDALKYQFADSLLRLIEAQLSEKKEQLRLMGNKEGEVAANHIREIANLEGQITTLTDQVEGFEKMYKKEKRKRRLSQGVGAIATLAAIVVPLIINK